MGLGALKYGLACPTRATKVTLRVGWALAVLQAKAAAMEGLGAMPSRARRRPPAGGSQRHGRYS